MTRVAICICTYRRNELLFKLLNSIFKQKINSDLEYDIYIVDNYGKAQLYNKIIELNKKNIFYNIEHNRGISHARNRCIDEVKGKKYNFIIFVDDDEYVCSTWLQSLVDCAYRYEAELVSGPVISVLPDSTKDWIVKSKFFQKTEHITGSIMKSCGCGNVLISTQLIEKQKIHFSLEYGLTGGEDTKLFKTLVHNGKKLVYCKEAIAYEHVDNNRLSMKYMLKRIFINSLVYVKIDKELYNKFQVIVKRVVASIAFILMGIVLVPLIVFKGRLGIYQAMKHILKGTGQLAGVIGYTKNLY